MTELAATFINELPPEYIQHIIDNPDYVLDFVGHPVAFEPSSDKTQNMLLKAENASMEILNKYYTQLLREKLTPTNNNTN